MSYAIISLGGKQHRVREGEWLLVDRVPTEPGKTFHPRILMLGGDGNANFDANGATVTVKVVEHVLGEKIRIGKYRPKNGYKRHTGYRSRLSKIEVQSISVKAAAAKAQPEPVEAEGKPKAAETPKPAAASKPKAAPKPKVPAVAEEKPEALAVAEEKPKTPAKPKAPAKPKPAAAKPKAPAKPNPAAAAKPKPAAAAKPKAPARKPAPKKETDT